MADYSVSDRRPIKEVFRKLAYGVADTCVKRGIHANTISYFSMVWALIAGVMLYLSVYVPWLLLLAPWFAMLRLYFNMLDGMVALQAKEASAVGEVINELPDRVSDTLIFLGLALSPFGNMMLSFWVIFGMLAVSYIGVLGKAVGANRQYGGLMAKPVRVYILVVGCTVQFIFLSDPTAPDLIWGYSIMDIGLGIILLGLIQTAVSRLVSIIKKLTS